MKENVEKAREIANNCCQWYSEYNSSFTDCAKSALEMADWKDEKFAKEKQAFIDEACEWWEKEFKISMMDFQDSKDFYNKKLENFRKAMEETK